MWNIKVLLSINFATAMIEMYPRKAYVFYNIHNFVYLNILIGNLENITNVWNYSCFNEYYLWHLYIYENVLQTIFKGGISETSKIFFHKFTNRKLCSLCTNVCMFSEILLSNWIKILHRNFIIFDFSYTKKY